MCAPPPPFLGEVCVVLWALALKGALWAPALLYGLWMLADRNTPRRGGRRSEWVRKWTIWRYFRDYFPISVGVSGGGGGEGGFGGGREGEFFWGGGHERGFWGLYGGFGVILGGLGTLGGFWGLFKWGGGL